MSLLQISQVRPSSRCAHPRPSRRWIVFVFQETLCSQTPSPNVSLTLSTLVSLSGYCSSHAYLYVSKLTLHLASDSHDNFALDDLWIHREQTSEKSRQFACQAIVVLLIYRVRCSWSLVLMMFLNFSARTLHLLIMANLSCYSQVLRQHAWSERRTAAGVLHTASVTFASVLAVTYSSVVLDADLCVQ